LNFFCLIAYLALSIPFILWFEASPSAGEFQEVEGESEERRKARLERLQRAKERAVCFLYFVL